MEGEDGWSSRRIMGNGSWGKFQGKKIEHSYIKKGKGNNETGMVKRGGGWEERVEEGVWAGLTNTKDFMKDSCEKLLRNYLKYKHR